jgi:hypothetical protein
MWSNPKGEDRMVLPPMSFRNSIRLGLVGSGYVDSIQCIFGWISHGYAPIHDFVGLDAGIWCPRDH